MAWFMGERTGERSWLESWLDLTTRWIEPAARASVHAASYGPERALAELVDGLVQCFGEGRVEFSVRGRSVEANLDWLRLVRRKQRYEAHLQLSNVEVDGFAFEHLSAVAQSLQFDPGVHPRLTLSDIEVTGQSALAPVIRWLDTRLPGWVLAIDDAGTVVARHAARGLTLEVEPSVDHDQLQLELRALRWGQRRLPVPGWLRLRRTTATVSLPPGVSVIEARRRGAVIDFRLGVQSIQQDLELAQLRDALLQGARPVL